jgi:hypothetical protein
MNADAYHGGLRPKRCLPAKFHSTAHTDLPRDLADPIAGRFVSKHPQVTADNSHCPKARQLTLFYRLLPYLCRIRAKA